jgi:hypothetical protein
VLPAQYLQFIPRDGFPSKKRLHEEAGRRSIVPDYDSNTGILLRHGDLLKRLSKVEVYDEVDHC